MVSRLQPDVYCGGTSVMAAFRFSLPVTAPVDSSAASAEKTMSDSGILRIQKSSRGGCAGGAKAGGCDESHPPGIRGLEVILHTELHIARPNSVTQTGDLPEVVCSKGKPPGIAEHGCIGDILDFETNLDPLAFPGSDALQQRGVQRLD